jgi:hypothetical protein
LPGGQKKIKGEIMAESVKKPAKTAKTDKPVKAKKPEKTVKAEKAAKTTKAKAPKTQPELKVMDLFDAYAQNMLPKDQAYIVSSFINGKTGYSTYEVISYSGVKAIYPDGDGLTFQSSGKKLHILIEPASYPQKAVQPFLRDGPEQIPLRFSELTLITTRNQIKLFIAKKPIDSLSAFTVARPVGYNFSFLFYKGKDIYHSMVKFFEHSFNKDMRIPLIDSKKAAAETVSIVEELMAFKSEFGG